MQRYAGVMFRPVFQAIIRFYRKNSAKLVMYRHCVGRRTLMSVVISDKVTTFTIAVIKWIAKVTETWWWSL